MSSARQHSEKRIEKWKTLYCWLQFSDEQKIVCRICSLQKDRICSMKNLDSIFILGSTNFQASALTDHNASRCRNQAVTAGRSLPPRKVVQYALSNQPIVQGIQIMGDTVKKLLKLAYYSALKHQPFLNFKEKLETEQMHCVKHSRTK